MNYKSANYKVFQIGFNRCGTTSLHELFKGSGYRSVHYAKGWLAYKMKDNLLKRINSTAFPVNHKILDEVEQFTFYSDMENVYSNTDTPIYAYMYFKELYYDYPNAKFIFNYRPFYDWVNSRLNFSDKYKLKFLKNTNICSDMPETFVSNNERSYWDMKINDDIYESWKWHYDTHMANVFDFFKDKPNKLLIYDISKDSSDKIFDFFADLELDKTKWMQHNTSKK